MWRFEPALPRRGAIKIMGSPFKSFDEAEVAPRRLEHTQGLDGPLSPAKKVKILLTLRIVMRGTDKEEP